MPETKHVQFSFSGGEVSPDALGRGDIDKFQSSTAMHRNWISLSHGPTINRAGTELVGYEHQPKLNLISRGYSATFQTNPLKLTANAHGLSSGDTITITRCSTGLLTGIESEIEVEDANTLYVLNYDGSDDSTSATGAYYPVSASAANRVVSFEFSASNSYDLYFGDRYMMVSRDGALVLESSPKTLSALAYAGGTDNRLIAQTSSATGFWSNDEVFLSSFTPVTAKDHGEKRYRIHNVVGGTSFPISGLTNANPCVVTTSAPHTYLDGDQVIVLGINVSFHQLNGYEYTVRNPTATTIELEDQWGDPVDSTNMDAYSAAGTVDIVDSSQMYLDGTGNGTASGSVTLSPAVTMSRYYILRTPYTAADLANMKFAQTQDAMTITCDGFAPRKLVRVADDNWTLTETTFIPSIDPPLTITASTTGTTHLAKVTAVSKGTGEESVAKEKYVGTSPANTLTIATVDGAFEYNVYISRLNSNDAGFAGITDSSKVTVDTSATAPERDQTIRPPSFVNPFFVDGTASTISGATKDDPIEVTHDAAGSAIAEGQFVRLESVTGMPELDNKIFRAVNVTSTTFDLQYTDGTGHVAVGTAGSVIPLTPTDYPTAVTYYQQRLVLANTPLHPLAIYATRSRSYDSMGTSFPLNDADAIALEVFDITVNPIRHLVPMSSLLAFTAGGIYEIVGNEQGILTPTASYPVPQSAEGCNNVPPIRVGTNVIYVTDQASNVVELIPTGSTGTRNAFVQGEPYLSTLSRHLLDGYSVVDAARATHPDSMVWYVRSDGILLGLTLVSGAQVVAWSHHDTQGDFESVSTSSGSPHGYTNLVVKRDLNNVTKRYFERFNARDFDDVEDAWFVDCGLKFDEAYTATTKLGSLSPLRFYVDSSHAFSAGDQLDVTHKIRVTSGIVNGALHKSRLAVTTAGADYIDVEDLDGAAFDGTAALSGVDTRTLTVHRCTKTVAGADHLIGVEVAILADGVAQPNKTVTADGTLTFDDFHSRYIIGLPIEADIKTLAPDTQAGPFRSYQGRKMRVLDAVLNVNETFGLMVGTSESNLKNIKWALTPTLYGTAAGLRSGSVYAPITREWGDGSVFIRQSDPLPATLLSLRTDLEVA